MDYKSMHGPGISNFSSSSPHRLPTVSAAQALQDLKASPTRCISSGMRDLDAILQNRDLSTILPEEDFHGGVSKGKVTEIYGPPGVGKTSLGMQLAASALYAGDSVIWVDASHPVPGPRFSRFLESFQPLTRPSASPASDQVLQRSAIDLIDKLTHFSTPTLAHLIVLLTNQTPSHPDQKTSLIIVDSFSTLISNAFPKTIVSTPRKPGAPNPSSRKFPILQFLVNSLQKLAATRNIAVVILSQCVTKMRPGLGAALVPAISMTPWEQGIGCRVAIFRDWGWDDDEGTSVHDVRLVEVLKAEGVEVSNGKGKLVGFSISETGLHQLSCPNLTIRQNEVLHPLGLIHNEAQTESPTLPPIKKRKLSTTNFEIPDSDAEDDEDYGWAEEDEESIPPMPPQWQGSEDILVPRPGELEAEDEEDEIDHDLDLEDKPGGHSEKPVREEVADSEDELAL